MIYNSHIPREEPYELGKCLYILGTASRGPVNEPVLLNTIEKAKNIFGDNSPLTKFYSGYIQAGGGPAYLVKINGTYASKVISVSYVDDDTLEIIEKDLIEITYLSSGESGNEIPILFFGNSMSIFGYEFTFEEDKTIEMLAHEINVKLQHGIDVIPLVENNESSVLLSYVDSDTIMLEGGISGLDDNKNDLYYKLEKTLDILLGKHVDVITLVGMYFDDTYPLAYISDNIYGDMFYIADRDYLDIVYNDERYTYHKLLIKFCEKQRQYGIYTHSILGMNQQVENPEDGPLYMLEATAIGTEDGLRETSGDYVIDYGKFLSVCYGDLIYNVNTSEEFIDNCYIAIIAAYIQSNYNESLTAYKLPDELIPVNLLPDYLLYNITNLGVVTIKNSPLKGLCITAGITLAIKTSPMFLAINNKIIQRSISVLERDLNIYLNSPNEPVTNESIGRAIENSLNNRISENIIKDFYYTVDFNVEQKLTTINLDLYSIFSTEKISANTIISI